MKKNEIENIIFDLGKVLLNLDYTLSIKAFEKINCINFNFPASATQLKKLFDDFEIGIISAKEFRNNIRAVFNTDATDTEINQAWNAMLLDFPIDRINLLKELKAKDVRLFLLSNTNEIHINHFVAYMTKTYGESVLLELFEKIYYSYELGMRKPETSIYQHILIENTLNPPKTLFIDDSIDNIKGAIRAGIKTYHLKEEEAITKIDFFSCQF